MSLEKQTYPKIIEGGRIWPYYEATGFPVMPKKVRCVGREQCPAIAKNGSCKFTMHHLLFEKNRVRSFGHPYDLLVDNEFMIVPVSECRHNYIDDNFSSIAIHDRYDRAHIPDKPLAYKALDEFRLLKATLSSATDMYEYVAAGLRGFRAFDKTNQERKLHTVSERFVDATVRFEHVRAQLGTIEVIPERMVQKALYDAYVKRSRIREVFLGDSLERIPQPLVDAAVEVELLKAA